MAFSAGQRVGDYEILDLLGTGGMGCVYRVRHMISDRVEAMKILLPDYASDQELASRFMTEIRTLATLEHPNIAQLRTAFQFENQLVMVMEYVEGSTLDYIASQSGRPQAQVVEYAMQVLSALNYAHGVGVIHRDIKPSNIMVTSHGLAKIMDFGIAKSTIGLQLTRPGTTMGSVYYMSPEQIRGGTVDARSDIYSFGVTLYEMCTGRRPFQADTSFSVLNAQLNEQPQPPIEINPALSPALNSIILCAMAKDPGQRFQSAEAFRNALKASQEVQQEIPAAVPPPQASPQPQLGVARMIVPGPASSRSHRGLWVATGAVVALAVLAAAALLLPHVFSTHASQQAPPQPAAETQTKSVSATTTTPAAAPNASTAPASGSQSDAAGGGSSPAPSSVPQPPTDGHPDAEQTGSHRGPQILRKPHAPGNPGVPPTERSAQGGSDQPSEPSAPSPAEVRASRDRLANLEARAAAVGSGIQSIRAQQQAHGLDLRGDILAVLSRLNSDLNESNTALNQNDLAPADGYMDRADRELATLEKFLGR